MKSVAFKVKHMHKTYPPREVLGQISKTMSYYCSWLESTWIEDYWSGLDKGEALYNMILAREQDASKYNQYVRDVFHKSPRPYWHKYASVTSWGSLKWSFVNPTFRCMILYSASDFFHFVNVWTVKSLFQWDWFLH